MANHSLQISQREYASARILNYLYTSWEISMHARRSVLFDQEKPWVKRNNELLFDVSVVSSGGALLLLELNAEKRFSL